MRLSLILAPFLFATACLRAQDADPLSYTLPNGKVLHFETAEQRAKFLTAGERAAQGTFQQPVPAASPRPSPAAFPAGASTPTETYAGPGVGNPGAPMLTADYYTLRPETWLGKQITLSVAYVHPANSEPRDDGLVQLEAHTYGIVGGASGPRSGGWIMILAKPAAAQRVSSVCGTTYQYTAAGGKMSIIKGEMTVLKTSSNSHKEYGLFVDK